MKKFLAVFSYLFHPLFIPVYATLFYFFITRSYFYDHEIYLIFVQVVILTVLVPLCIFYLLRSLGLISSKMILNDKERRIPLACQAILLFILIKYSLSASVLPELYYYFTGCLISALFCLALVLVKHKASLHMLGVTTLTLFIISISLYYHIQLLYLIAFFVMCIGFTASSRLQAKAHTMNELILGILAGAVPQVLLWYLWLVPAV